MNKNKIATLAVFLCFFIAPAVHGATTLEIPGTGDSQALLHELAEVFNAAQGEVSVVIPDSIGSGGGIKSVATGRNEIARIGRFIKKKEQRYNLNFIQFAASPVVFAISRNVTGVETLTADQVTGIYSGKITNWNALGVVSGKIYVINREPGDSSRDVLDETVAGFKEIADFTGVVLYSTPETAETLESHDDTIAYLPFSMAIGKNMKPLKFGGVGPLETGYPLISPFGLVWQGEMSGAAKKFTDFLFSDQGQKIINRSGAVAVKR